MRYSTWEEAHTAAQTKATAAGLDIAIRKVKEYGKWGYNISFAAKMDSDYALAEIVHPNPED